MSIKFAPENMQSFVINLVTFFWAVMVIVSGYATLPGL